MSTIKSSAEHLTLNADGASKDIKFQANGVEKASISSSGAFTSTTIDATALTGDLPAISGANLTGVGVAGITSTADGTAITIDSSENVGIGVTPEAWQSTRNTLQIGAGAVFANGTGAGSDVEITQNAYYDGSWKYINTDEASRHYQNSGTHTFDVAPSGTADSAISWTTAMTINNDGSLTNNTGVYKIGTQTTATSTDFNFDATEATTISCAQNTQVRLSTKSNQGGLIHLCDTSVTGQSAFYLSGSGTVQVVAESGSVFTTGSSPSSSEISLYRDPSADLFIINGRNQTVNISMITFATRGS